MSTPSNASSPSGSAEPAVPRPEAEAVTLEQNSDRLPKCARTEEDLEDLAAERIALPVEKLEAVRRKFGFPQGWYDEDSKPF